MKPSFRNFFFFAVTAALFGNTAMASKPFEAGDLSLIFYSFSGTVVEPTTYVVNLGQSHLYRDNTKTDVSLTEINSTFASSNIGADLVATFGDDWAERGTVHWAVIGGVRSSDPTTEQDPARTIYMSRSRTQLSSGANLPGSVIADISSTNRGALSSGLFGFYADTNGAIAGVGSNSSTSGSNAAGVILPTSNLQSPDKFLPPTTPGLYFGQGIDIRQKFSTGVVAGGVGVEGALDLYRVIHTATGAKLTAGMSPSSPAVVGRGQFIGTLTIDSAGNLKMGVPGGITPTNNFTSWATTNNVTGGPGGDSDGDGITNFMEYAINLNLTGPDAAIGTFNAGTLSYAKRSEAVANGDVSYAIEQSDDLGATDPWKVVTPTANDSTSINYLLPAGKARSFARLKVSSIAP